LRSGTPLEEALDVLHQTAHPVLRNALVHLKGALPEKANFVSAAAGLMAPDTMAIIGDFERRGYLGAGLEAVALGLEGRGFVRRRFLFVMAYPLFVAVVAIALLPLPSMAQNNMNFSQYGRVVGLYYLQFAFWVWAVLWGLPWSLRSSGAAAALRRSAWLLPWPASVYVQAMRALFSKILAHNVEVGMPMADAVPAAAVALGDGRVQAVVDGAEPSSDVGALMDRLGLLGLVAAADRMFVASSVHTGAIGETMETLAPQYQKQYSSQLWVCIGLAGCLLFMGTGAVIGNSILGYFESQLGSVGGLLDQGPFKDISEIQSFGSEDHKKTLRQLERLDPLSPSFEKQLKALEKNIPPDAERLRRMMPRAGPDGIYSKGDLKEFQRVLRSH